MIDREGFRKRLEASVAAGKTTAGRAARELRRRDAFLEARRRRRNNEARTDAPSFLTKVKNFAIASAKHIAAGAPMASDEEIIRRHDICLGCEFLKDNACTKCGCPVVRNKQYVSKLSWADSACPVGKWGKEATGK
jgi:hypothetical protein